MVDLLGKTEAEQLEILDKELDKDTRFIDIERKIDKAKRKEGAQLAKKLIDLRTTSPKGETTVMELKKKYHLKFLRKTAVKVFLGLGDRVKVKSRYASKGEKRGKKGKRGSNGNGAQLLLKFWGFWKKYSPLFVSHVVRAGVSCGSYDLAEEELKERGYQIDSNQIGNLVQDVGQTIQEHRDKISLEAGESLANKRILIAADGGRIRTRQSKKRKKKGHKFAGYTTEWKEPKLLVIQELDEKGKKKKGTKPIYEATMQGLEKFYELLVGLCLNLEVKDAKEVVFLGDGADWLWNIYEKLSQELKLEKKVTFIADWYHAVEHITEIAEAHPHLTNEKDRKVWVRKMGKILERGKFSLFRRKIYEEVMKLEADKKEEAAGKLIKIFAYFEKRRDKMKYDEYKRKNLPIGSGAVESAIRRVINLRLKSAGTFWKIENLERILPLRCALMAGRWRTLMDNFIDCHRLKLE